MLNLIVRRPALQECREKDDWMPLMRDTWMVRKSRKAYRMGKEAQKQVTVTPPSLSEKVC